MDGRLARFDPGAWWRREMDATRLVAVLICATGLVLFFVGVAANPEDMRFTGSGGSISLTLIAAYRGFVHHRTNRTRWRLLWAIAFGGSVVLVAIAMDDGVAALRPLLRRDPTLGSAASWIVFSSFVLAAIGSLLWERDPRSRRFGALWWVAILLLFAGFLAIRAGNPWITLGGLMLALGILCYVVALILSIEERERTRAAKSTARRDA